MGLIGNIKGPPGADGNNGTNGATWRDGSGAPSNGLGVDGDYYLDDDTGDVYLKSAGNYTVVANIKGPSGASGGSVIAAGIDYLNGATIIANDDVSEGDVVVMLPYITHPSGAKFYGFCTDGEIHLVALNDDGSDLRMKVNYIVVAATEELGPYVKLDSDIDVTASGGTVSQWNDQTVNENNPAQGTAGSRPALVAAQLNGYPAIRFDGINDGLGIGVTGMSEYPERYTYHGVFDLKTLASRRIFDSQTKPLLGISAGLKWFVESVASNIVSAVTATTGVHYFTLIMAGSGNTSKLYIDGVLVASGDLGDQDMSFTGLSLPSEFGNTEIDWYRFRIYAYAFTDAKRLAVEADTVSKYAL